MGSVLGAKVELRKFGFTRYSCTRAASVLNGERTTQVYRNSRATRCCARSVKRRAQTEQLVRRLSRSYMYVHGHRAVAQHRSHLAEPKANAYNRCLHTMIEAKVGNARAPSPTQRGLHSFYALDALARIHEPRATPSLRALARAACPDRATCKNYAARPFFGATTFARAVQTCAATLQRAQSICIHTYGLARASDTCGNPGWPRGHLAVYHDNGHSSPYRHYF